MSAPACPAPDCGGTNVYGVEVRWVYDGVLFWICWDCNHAWTRDWTGHGRREQAAADFVATRNRAVEGVPA